MIDQANLTAPHTARERFPDRFPFRPHSMQCSSSRRSTWAACMHKISATTSCIVLKVGLPPILFCFYHPLNFRACLIRICWGGSESRSYCQDVRIPSLILPATPSTTTTTIWGTWVGICFSQKKARINCYSLTFLELAALPINAIFAFKS
jgi:hypothetical protein